jgi:hypothetical protein
MRSPSARSAGPQVTNDTSHDGAAASSQLAEALGRPALVGPRRPGVKHRVARGANGVFDAAPEVGRGARIERPPTGNTGAPRQRPRPGSSSG